MSMIFMEILPLECYAVPELPPSRNPLHNCTTEFLFCGQNVAVKILKCITNLVSEGKPPSPLRTAYFLILSMRTAYARILALRTTYLKPHNYKRRYIKCYIRIVFSTQNRPNTFCCRQRLVCLIYFYNSLIPFILKS